MSQKQPSGMPTLRINAAGGSYKGRTREHNEDMIALYEPSNPILLEQLGHLYLLADGVGGHAAGEVASRLAVETIASFYYDQDTLHESVAYKTSSFGSWMYPENASSDMTFLSERIRCAFLTAHERILQKADVTPEYTSMATTCVAAIVKGTRLLIAHVGDSRAYLLDSTVPPTVTRLTTDHSMVAELARVGAITVEQMQTSSNRHIILRALGGRQQSSTEPDISIRDIHAGESLLLCCDGIWDMVSETQIAIAMSKHSPQEACSELVRLANEAGGNDDSSAIVIAFM